MFDNKNLFVFLLLSAVVLFSWEYLYNKPLKEKQAIVAAAKKKEEVKNKSVTAPVKTVETEIKDRGQIIAASPRVKISSETLHGSISLKGLRFDDLTLAGFRQHLDKNSPEVVLLSPSNASDSYFAETGWLAGDSSTRTPDSNSLWQASENKISAGKPIDFTWENGAGLKFTTTVALDENYMFTLKKRVKNNTGKAVELYPYGLINRLHQQSKGYYVLSSSWPFITPIGPSWET